MGGLIHSMAISRDDLVETPSQSSTGGHVDDERHSFFNDQTRELSGSLYGRRMYELMVGHRPSAQTDPSTTAAMRESAGIWKAIPRVASRGRFDE